MMCGENFINILYDIISLNIILTNVKIKNFKKI